MYMCLSCSYGFALLFPCIHFCVFLLCLSVCGGGGGGGVFPSTAGWSHIFMTGFIDYNWATFLIELLEWVCTILEFWR